MCSLKSVQAEFLDFYNRTMVASLTRVRPELHELFTPILEAVTADEFLSVIVPTLERLLKRSPEVIFVILPAMLSRLRFDMSSFFRSKVRSWPPFVSALRTLCV
jgi:hypothetical protein